MDTYKYHKLAMGPLINQSQDSLKEIHSLSPMEKVKLVNFVQINGLGTLWHQLLKKHIEIVIFPQELIKSLEQTSKWAVARYLMQKHVMDTVATLFEEESIVYAIFKGAHLREIIYKQPTVREASDIDILIHPSDRNRAINTLINAGFVLEVKQQNISHEVTLVSRNVAIDLHWHILRPGRLRQSLTDEFLEKRYDYTTHIGFDAETTLFIMLVHPVFTKYSTTSLASLIRFVDLLQWIEQQQIDWDSVLVLLRKYGVSTAAWITAVYLHEVTGQSLPHSFVQHIKPSLFKQWYLKSWIQSNRASKMLSHPFLIQVGFTLPAHDSILDAVRFLRTLSLEKKQSQGKTETLLAAIEESRVEKIKEN